MARMSDTPRTDRTDLYDYQTAVDFARELERENNALRADCRNCFIKRLVLRHIKLDGRFRIKRNPARSALAGMALVEKEYAPGKWREYGIVSADEFVPQNAGHEPRQSARKDNMSKYQYTDDMSELSGFGGGYEDTLRAMVVSGLEHLDANPHADPQFSGYKNIFGIITEDNADGKELSEAVVKAANGDCTGAMHQAAISHILWIRNNGWDQYCAEMRKRKAAEANT